MIDETLTTIDKTLNTKWFLEDVIYFSAHSIKKAMPLFSSLFGVKNVTVGLASGVKKDVTFNKARTNEADYKETIRVVYKHSFIPLGLLIRSFFLLFESFVLKAQTGEDTSPFPMKIFYHGSRDRIITAQCINFSKQKYHNFPIKYEPLGCFAEDKQYHQNSLLDNEIDDSHINDELMNHIKEIIEFELVSRLTDHTDYLEGLFDCFHDNMEDEEMGQPFLTDYCSSTDEGIYVDYVSRQPLFLSSDKIINNDGYPVFKAPIFSDSLVLKPGIINGKKVFIVTSRYERIFLGYYTKKGSYVINCEPIDFIPRAKMKANDYGPYIAFLPSKDNKKKSK